MNHSTGGAPASADQIPQIPRASLTDPEILGALPFQAIRKYLTRTGWTNAGTRGDGIFREFRLGQTEHTLLIPENDGAEAHDLLASAAIRRIADAEKRTELEVFWDLSGTGAVVISAKTAQEITSLLRAIDDPDGGGRIKALIESLGQKRAEPAPEDTLGAEFAKRARDELTAAQEAAENGVPGALQRLLDLPASVTFRSTWHNLREGDGPDKMVWERASIDIGSADTQIYVLAYLHWRTVTRTATVYQRKGGPVRILATQASDALRRAAQTLVNDRLKRAGSTG